jgi:hypothetical protein
MRIKICALSLTRFMRPASLLLLCAAAPALGRKKETPFIENVCVGIRATPDSAAEIVREADWPPLNAALTP